MKRLGRFFATGQAAIILGAFVMAQVAMPLSALAAGGYITLDSFSGYPGVALQVSGGGWTSGDTLQIYVGAIDASPEGTAMVTDGMFSASVTIPANKPQGPLPIIVVDSTSNQASNSYYVIPRSADISNTAPSHTPFGTVAVSGSGFSPNEIVTLTLATATSTVSANASGAFSGAGLTIPAVPAGVYELRAIGVDSGAQAVNYFWIDTYYPSITPSAYYIVPGGTLSFDGSGYAPGETINITADGAATVLGSFTANTTGGFVAAGSFPIPVSFRGSNHSFTLTGQNSGASTNVTIAIGDLYPWASPSSWYILPGSDLKFTGGGFGGSETINIYQGLASTPVTSFTTDTDGSFSLAGATPIPFGGSGSITYRLRGLLSGVESLVTTAVGAFYPSVTPSAYYLAPGAPVSLAGSGFGANESITIKADGTTIATATADADGAFTSSSFTVPYSGAAITTLSASGALSNASASVSITNGQYYPTVTPSAYWVSPGSNISFTGAGFAPGETVTVSSGGATVSTLISMADGTLPVNSFTIPFGSHDSIRYTFTGTNSHASAYADITVGASVINLSADTYYAQPGSVINITGTGFSSGEAVTITAGSATVNATANTSGTVTSPITLPFSSGSSIVITAVGAASGGSASVSISFAPYAPQVSPSTYYTTPGSSITFTGSGFASGETVNATFNGTGLPSFTADASGAFTQTLTIPYGSSAAHYVFTGALTSQPATVDIGLATFSGSIVLSSYWAQAGSPWTVTGYGFASGEQINLAVGGQAVGSVTADTSGNFSHSTTMPFTPAGSQTIIATGASSATVASANYTVAEVYPNLSLGSYAGAPGVAVNFIGSSYLANEPIEIRTDRTGDTVVHSFTADSSGSFNNSAWMVPADFAEGQLTLKIKGLHSFTEKSIVYYVTGH